MTLRLAGYRTTLFVDGTYRWILEQTYLWSGTPSDGTAVLAQLIACPGYDMLNGPDESGEAAGKAHGPYVLDDLSAEGYRPVDTETAVGGLRSWAEIEGALPARINVELDRVVGMIEGATERYELPDLGAKARVARRYLFGWYELVLLDRTSSTVTMIAGSAD